MSDLSQNFTRLLIFTSTPCQVEGRPALNWIGGTLALGMQIGSEMYTNPFLVPRPITMALQSDSGIQAVQYAFASPGESTWSLIVRKTQHKDMFGSLLISRDA